jgi:mRNA interferase MazF
MSLSSGGRNPARGEVWSVSLDPTVGHEQAGTRPALVVSDNRLNQSLAGLVIVLPITGTDRGVPAHVVIAPNEGGLTKPSVILTDQVRTISHQRLGRRIGSVSAATMSQVEACLRRILGLCVCL